MPDLSNCVPRRIAGPRQAGGRAGTYVPPGRNSPVMPQSKAGLAFAVLELLPQGLAVDLEDLRRPRFVALDAG